MVSGAADDGFDPVCILRDRGKGVGVKARAACSHDEGVDPVDQPVADQRPAGVPLWAEPGEVRGWASGTPPTAHGVDSPC